MGRSSYETVMISLYGALALSYPGGYDRHMSAHPSHPDIVKRLKRASGHLKSIIDMLEGDRDCLDIAQQLQAVEKAVANPRRRWCTTISTTASNTLSKRARAMSRRRCASSRKSPSIYSAAFNAILGVPGLSEAPFFHASDTAIVLPCIARGISGGLRAAPRAGAGAGQD